MLIWSMVYGDGVLLQFIGAENWNKIPSESIDTIFPFTWNPIWISFQHSFSRHNIHIYISATWREFEKLQYS